MKEKPELNEVRRAKSERASKKSCRMMAIIPFGQSFSVYTFAQKKENKATTKTSMKERKKMVRAKRNFPHSLNMPDFDVNFMTRQLNWQYTILTKKGAKNYETNFMKRKKKRWTYYDYISATRFTFQVRSMFAVYIELVSSGYLIHSNLLDLCTHIFFPSCEKLFGLKWFNRKCDYEKVKTCV